MIRIMGLSAFGFMRPPPRARRTTAELKAGMVSVNSFVLVASEAPFAGTNFRAGDAKAASRASEIISM